MNLSLLDALVIGMVCFCMLAALVIWNDKRL